jgi:hypothetical protein
VTLQKELTMRWNHSLELAQAKAHMDPPLLFVYGVGCRVCVRVVGCGFTRELQESELSTMLGWPALVDDEHDEVKILLVSDRRRWLLQVTSRTLDECNKTKDECDCE